MGIATLYEEKKSAFAPPPNQVPYEQYIFNMERNGTNDLVERNVIDPTFRPPIVANSYLARLFEEGQISQL